jgi:Uma2 family endonuclease
MIATKQSRLVQKTPRNVPRHLVYEIIDGKPFYYKGYREVLDKTKNAEQIMGSSSLQSLLVTYCTVLLSKLFDEDSFFVLSGEAGVHINHRTNLANDVALYHQSILPPSKISVNYADVPPELAIEIDVKADLEDLSETGYIHLKTRKLLQFGVKKVIWVLTEAQVVMVATTDQIQTFDWHQDIALTAEHSFNLAVYLQKRGIMV